MTYLNSSLHFRLALGGTFLSMAVMLAACGGGTDDKGAAAASEASLAVATEAVQAQAPSTAGSVVDGSDSKADSVFGGRVPLDAWETEHNALASQAFLVSQQAKAVSMERAMTAREASTDTRVKWNPGHYIASGKRDPQTVAKILAEIKPFPQVKGLLLRYDWSQLETDKGVYDFSKIDRDLALVSAQGKRLFVMVSTKVFTAGVRAVPDYLHRPEYEGGAYKILIGARTALGSSERYGENAALHNANVRDRIIALTTVLGNRYNGHNAFEGVTFNETAMGQTLVPLNEDQRTAYFTNLAQVDAAAKRAFPNTVVMQFINFPRTYMPGLITSMVNSKVALGGPDILLEDRDLNSYIYPLYDMAKGKVAVGPSVQPENYLTTTQNGVHNPPKISDLYNFGRTRLSANYLFWSRSMTGTPTPWPRVLDFFNSSAFPKDASGGLTSTCPTTYVSCTPNL